MQDDWFDKELEKTLGKYGNLHYRLGQGVGDKTQHELVLEAKQAIIDLFISLVEQESFLDPTTGEQTFYTEQLVKRLRGQDE